MHCLSDRDFINKLKIVEEELDETIFWMEIFIDAEMIKEKHSLLIRHFYWHRDLEGEQYCNSILQVRNGTGRSEIRTGIGPTACRHRFHLRIVIKSNQSY